MKSMYLKNALPDFKTFCTKRELKGEPFKRNSQYFAQISNPISQFLKINLLCLFTITCYQILRIISKSLHNSFQCLNFFRNLKKAPTSGFTTHHAVSNNILSDKKQFQINYSSMPKYTQHTPIL